LPSEPIIRIWRGITAQRLADEYFVHIQERGIPSYRHVEGNLAACVLRRDANGATEFLVISVWESWDAIRRFTGSEDPNVPVYYPDDDRLLMFKEPKVVHYELALLDGCMSIAHLHHNAFEGTS